LAIKFPTNTKEVIDQIRSAIGREITFVIFNEEECPDCSRNPVTGGSVDPFCITCSGVGYLYTQTRTTISGHVAWGPFDEMQWVSGGRFYQGDCGAQIEYTIENLDTVDSCRYVLVDGKQLSIKNKVLRGIPTLNRILLDLVEEE
jgi:hypothetical protein